MARYLVVFGAHAMDHIPEDQLPAVSEAAHEVCREAIAAGAFVLAGGIDDGLRSTFVGSDGTLREGRYPDPIGGVTIVEVPSREHGLMWAKKVADACRCEVELIEIRADPELEAMLGEAGS